MNVYYKINRLLYEEKDKSEYDDVVVLFRTGGEYPYGEKTIPYIKAFSFIDKPEYYGEEFVDSFNPQFPPVNPLTFMLFSLDNEHYVDYISKIKNNYFDIQTAIKENENNPDFYYYVCDVTRSFYCKITMDYHKYFNKKMLEPIVDGSIEENVKRIHYYNEFLFYYSNLLNEENYVSPYEIQEFVLCTFSWNSDYTEVYNAEYMHLPKEEIFDINEDISENTDRDETIENSEICLKQMEELLNRKHLNNLSVFGYKVNIPTSNELTNKFIFMTPVVFMLNSEINSRKITDTKISKGLNQGFKESQEILIDRTVKNDFNAESAAQNMYDYIWNCTIYFKAYIYPFFKYALLANPKTIYLYNILDEFGEQVTHYVLDLQNDEQIMTVAEELPATLYFNQFYSQMQSYLEKASTIKDNVDNFEGGFVGGGFGIRGALKGILMASVANAVVKTAYSVHQYKKIDYDKIDSYLNEFLKTEHSKAFINEMMVLDIKYMFIKSLSISNEMENSLERMEKEEQILLRDNLGIQWYKDLLERYVRSAKLYAIALSKQLHLTVIPEYEEFESYYEMQPTALLEEAILAFPYDSLYYEQYMNFGGEITKELEDYASINLVDLSSVRERYETSQRIQRELDEKLRKEEEERKRKEQEAEAERIRKEQEAKEAAQKKLAETFGDIAKDFADLFSLMSDNPIYLSNPDKHFNSHNELTTFIFDYINENFKGVTTSMFPATSPQFSQKLRNLQNLHGYQVVTKDNALFCFDNTVFGSGKDGFVLTRNALCYRNIMESPVHVALKNIKTMKVVNGEICINDNKKINVSFCKLNKSDLLNILNYCICNLLVMPELLENTVIKAPEKNVSVNEQNPSNSKSAFPTLNKMINNSTDNKQIHKADAKLWKCGCGATNDETCLFCPTCGAKHIQNTEEWTCTSCGRKNPNQFVFCGSCGTKKEPIKKDWYCTSCGTKNPATSIFCGACGKKSE